MSDYWRDKLAVVTGGSSGLGLAVVRTLVQRGARTVLVSRDADRLGSAVRSVDASDDQCWYEAIDVCSDDSVQSGFDRIRSRAGRIDVLVNAAGISARQAILDTTPADFQRLWELNFLGSVRCTRAAADDLLAAKGHLVLIGSLASKTASRYLGAYPASKFPLAAYAQQLRLELEPQGLHVLLVCPGPLKREDAGHRYDSQAEGLPESARRPGGGARLGAIDPMDLAVRMLRECQRRRPELIVPSSAKWLFALAQLSPSWGDWIVRRKT